MGNFEAFSQESSEIKEIDWVQQQVKTELQDLQKESFYTTWDDGKVNYDMEAVKKYLTTIQQKNWSDLTSKNSSAWIMAVQIALEKRGIDVGKVDGIFGAGTRAAVRTFQEKNGITADGLPGSQTIAKLLEWEDKKPEWEDKKPEWEDKKQEWGDKKQEWGDKKPEWEDKKQEWGDKKQEWGDEKQEWGDKQSEWGDKQSEWEDEKQEWGDEKPKWGDKKKETATETPEKMDLTKVNVDVLKKVYGETIDKNWKGFQEKGNVIEIWGLKFKKWTEGMTGLGYKVKELEDDSSMMWFGQYIDGELTGKWVDVRRYWEAYQWDFLEDSRNWKGKWYWDDWTIREWGRKEDYPDGRGVKTWPDWQKFEGHREWGLKKWRGTTTYPNGDKRSINYENDNKWKWDHIFSTGEKIYWEWNWVDAERRECTRTMPDGKELKINMKDYKEDWIIEATSSENTIKIKVEKDYFVFQPESPRLAFPRGRKFDVFAIAHALNWAIKHVKDTQQKGTYKFDQFESSFSWDFVQVDREWAALDSDLIDTRKYPGMNATKVSDWLNANAKTFGLLNTKK